VHDDLDDRRRQPDHLVHASDDAPIELVAERVPLFITRRLLHGVERRDLPCEELDDLRVPVARRRHRLDDVSRVLRVVVAEVADEPAAAIVRREEADLAPLGLAKERRRNARRALVSALQRRSLLTARRLAVDLLSVAAVFHWDIECRRRRRMLC
jgi:hypothetical protein